MVNKVSVSQMREYLKYAVEFEKYVYIWTQSMNEANNHMRNINEEHDKLMNIQNESRDSLDNLDQRSTASRNFNENEAAKYKRYSMIALAVLLVILIILAIIGYCIGSKYSGGKRYLVWTMTLATPLGMGIFGPIPICLGICFYNRSKAKRFKDEADRDGEGSRRRLEIILADKNQKSSNALAVNAKMASAISKQQDEISTHLRKAKNDLSKHYALNILPPKYRCFNAVATLYEYLETGRCNTIEGHGGIYDTYERDLRLGIIIQNLIEVNRRLGDIQQNQQLLYSELQQANRSLSDIRTSMANIESSNAEIAKNTAISAVANQQTAAEAKWMSNRMWWHGF